MDVGGGAVGGTGFDKHAEDILSCFLELYGNAEVSTKNRVLRDG